jgi:hypothetical protein
MLIHTFGFVNLLQNHLTRRGFGNISQIRDYPDMTAWLHTSGAARRLRARAQDRARSERSRFADGVPN